VLQISGDAITSESGSNLASLITENSNLLIVDITEVSVGKKVPRWRPSLLAGWLTLFFLSRLIMLTISL